MTGKKKLQAVRFTIPFPRKEQMINRKRHLVAVPPDYLQCPRAQLQPIVAQEGDIMTDLDALGELLGNTGTLRPLITVKSPEHWADAVKNLDEEIDAILLFSIPALPNEVWNSHPQPLVEKKLPVIFWPLLDFNEQDMWRWAATDFLRSLGVTVYLPADNHEAVTVVRSLAMKRFFHKSKIVVFGKQNFPWNANAHGDMFKKSLGLDISVHSLQDFRDSYEKITDEQAETVWRQRKGRYIEKGVRKQELEKAIRIYLAIKPVLEKEKALAYGVNCYGDLLIEGGRDVPCLAQSLLREDGYIASCDGDYLTLAGMMFMTFLLDKPCMMSNIYPIDYEGAMINHFDNPLLPDEVAYPKKQWKNFARLGHCGFVGVAPPEMTPDGRAFVCEWAGTLEINRDGRGCGIDGELKADTPCTVIELKFDCRTLLITEAEICETTRHASLPHCESTALLRFRDLHGFLENISREHPTLAYGNHIKDLKVMGDVLGLQCHII